ncbi:MAG: efflux RND transporter periplasmic adaptor subunit [Chitinophagales bacterium]
MNKYLLTTLLAFSLLFFNSCGESEGKADTPEAKKALLEKQIKEKQIELAKAQSELQALEGEYLTYEPDYLTKQAESKKRIISTEKVQVKNFDQFVEFQGQVQTKDDFMISSDMGGVLKSLTIKEGEYVKSGQLVGRVDDDVMQRNVDELNLKLNLAKDIFERREKLWKQNIGSEIEYIQAKNNVESLQKSIATLQAQRGKTNIYAPNSGVVEEIYTNQGEVAGPGSPIAKIINTSNLQVVADIPENYLTSVRRGSIVKVILPALDNEEQTVKISKIGSMIDANNRTFQIEVPISNKGGKVKPNLMAMVEFKAASSNNAVVVPTNLVHNSLEGNFIFIVEKTDTSEVAKKVQIEVGDSYEGETLVLSGLKGDELLIADGSTLVRDGERVKVIGN